MDSEDIGYKRLDDFSGAPPSYDAVVGDPQPSAPPPSHIRPPYQEGAVPAHHPLPQDQNLLQDPPAAQRGTSSSKLNRFIKFYVSYSMAHHLRKYIIPSSRRLDPELDVEAQFSRRVVRDAQSRIAKGMRLQCITGWLWCFGLLQIFLYSLLPVGMLATGIIGINDCPHKSNIIIVYLLLSGSLVFLLILMRSLPSLMTCFRNRNYLNSKDSGTFTACICVFEIVFYILATANLVILVLETVWIFQDTDIPVCSSTTPDSRDCCSKPVYVASAFFNIFQYIMYAITSFYVCLVACCVRNMDKVYGSR